MREGSLISSLDTFSHVFYILSFKAASSSGLGNVSLACPLGQVFSSEQSICLFAFGNATSLYFAHYTSLVEHISMADETMFMGLEA
jgi:hypothetical protein